MIMMATMGTNHQLSLPKTLLQQQQQKVLLLLLLLLLNNGKNVIHGFSFSSSKLTTRTTAAMRRTAPLMPEMPEMVIFMEENGALKMARNHVDMEETSDSSNRRTFLQRCSTMSSCLIPLLPSLLFSPPLPAEAKSSSSSSSPTSETIHEAFQEVRSELSSPTGVLSTLTTLVQTQNYAEILEYTKETDAYFRKGKMGRARKFLTDSKIKDEAILICNAVTFDLIGINRASRKGKEDTQEAMRYVEEFKVDVERFLALEDTIVLPP